MTLFDLATYLLLLLLLVILLGSFYLFKITKIDALNKKHKAIRTNKQACMAIKRAIHHQNWTDYFWSNHMRAAWITLFLSFTIALSLTIAYAFSSLRLESIIIAIIVSVITFFFIRFAINSYKAFPEKAAQALKTFDEQIDASLKNEISFNGDNIQSFTDEDNNFDTEPQIFAFPVLVTKIPFPPQETAAPKQPIIATKKVEFLILSREYFIICKNASTFDLLDPKLAPEPKKCARLPATVGEGEEHYYSQMRNVMYDAKEECIRIMYYDERDDVEFKCKKIAPNRKPAMKALKEKLRLTERQRLHKIDEHEKYETILNRRESNNTSENESKDEDE